MTRPYDESQKVKFADKMSTDLIDTLGECLQAFYKLNKNDIDEFKMGIELNSICGLLGRYLVNLKNISKVTDEDFNYIIAQTKDLINGYLNLVNFKMN